MRSVRRLFSLLAPLSALGVAGLPQTRSPEPNVIHVEIERLRNDKGQVVCALYSSSDGFPKQTETALAHVNSAISDTHALRQFSGIPPCTYAVSVSHKENT